MSLAVNEDIAGRLDEVAVISRFRYDESIGVPHTPVINGDGAAPSAPSDSA